MPELCELEENSATPLPACQQLFTSDRGAAAGGGDAPSRHHQDHLDTHQSDRHQLTHLFPPSTASPAVQAARVVHLAASFILNEIHIGLVENKAVSPFAAIMLMDRPKTPNQALTGSAALLFQPKWQRDLRSHLLQSSSSRWEQRYLGTLCSQVTSHPC